MKYRVRTYNKEANRINMYIIKSDAPRWKANADLKKKIPVGEEFLNARVWKEETRK